LVPVVPTRAPGLPLPITGRTFLGNVQAWDPDFKLPYILNANLSITRSIRRNLILDIRYVGAFQRREDTTFDLNTFNVFNNKELFQALVDARAGQDPVLLDQMFAGLDLHGSSGTGYGPVGTVVNGVYQTCRKHMICPVAVANEMSGLKGRVEVASYPQRLRVDAVISGPSFGAGHENQRSDQPGDERRNQLDPGVGNHRHQRSGDAAMAQTAG
jgi:hypothetical protein